MVEQHCSIGRSYSYAVKMIIEKQMIQTSLALDGVATLRNDARSAVITALLDVRKQLGNFSTSKKQIASACYTKK